MSSQQKELPHLPAELWIDVFGVASGVSEENPADGYDLLQSLCLVSKRFNAIFTPLLYKDVVFEPETDAMRMILLLRTLVDNHELRSSIKTLTCFTFKSRTLIDPEMFGGETLEGIRTRRTLKIAGLRLNSPASFYGDETVFGALLCLLPELHTLNIKDSLSTLVALDRNVGCGWAELGNIVQKMIRISKAKKSDNLFRKVRFLPRLRNLKLSGRLGTMTIFGMELLPFPILEQVNPDLELAAALTQLKSIETVSFAERGIPRMDSDHNARNLNLVRMKVNLRAFKACLQSRNLRQLILVDNAYTTNLDDALQLHASEGLESLAIISPELYPFVNLRLMCLAKFTNLKRLTVDFQYIVDKESRELIELPMNIEELSLHLMGATELRQGGNGGEIFYAPLECFAMDCQRLCPRLNSAVLWVRKDLYDPSWIERIHGHFKEVSISFNAMKVAGMKSRLDYLSKLQDGISEEDLFLLAE